MMITGAFSCSPQARQLILQYGLTLSDLDRHPEVREAAGFFCLLFYDCHLFVGSGYLIKSKRKVSQPYYLFSWDFRY